MPDENVLTHPVTQPLLQRLRGMAKLLDEPGHDAATFVARAHAHGWVVEFSWTTWSNTAEPQHLINSRCADASVEQLERLISALCHQEAFFAGQIAEAQASGLVEGILQRMQCLLHAQT